MRRLRLERRGLDTACLAFQLACGSRLLRERGWPTVIPLLEAFAAPTSTAAGNFTSFFLTTAVRKGDGSSSAPWLSAQGATQAVDSAAFSLSVARRRGVALRAPFRAQQSKRYARGP
jgi:hypothetical protein